MEGPPLLPAAVALKGPHLQAFRQPGNPSTVRTVRAVTVKAHKGQEAAVQETSQPRSQVLLRRREGPRGHPLLSRGADCGARDLGCEEAQLGGSRLLLNLLGSKLGWNTPAWTCRV